MDGVIDPMENVIFSFAACLIGGLLMLVGGLFVVTILITVWNGIRTRSWPASFGRIVSMPPGADGSEELSQEAGKTVTQESAEFSYEYEVDGRSFTAKAIQYRGNAQSTITDRIEQELCSAYHIGNRVDVYYNPVKPEEAALKPGIPAGLLPLATVGVVLFLAGLSPILFFTRAGKLPADPRWLSVCFFVPGIALTVFALRMLWTVADSRNWPTTEARLLRSTVLEHRGQARGYQPSVAYQYVVDGITYTGTAIDWGRFEYRTRDKAQRVADEYVVGKSVMIHYDPLRPHRAVIEPRGSLMYVIVLLMGAGFTIFGIVIGLCLGAVSDWFS
jgi:hypothetical protein